MKTFNLELLTEKKLKQVNENGQRLYVAEDGSKYPSVTTALGKLNKKAIYEWRKRVGNEEANRISGTASRAGTAVHNIAEDYVLSRLPPKPPNPIAVTTFKTIQPYLDEHIGTVHGVELRMFSDELRTAGTADLIAYDKGELAVIDYKTSKRWKKKEEITTYFMQSAAYANMVKEHYGLEVKKIVVLMAVAQGEGLLTFEERLEDWAPMTKKYFDLYHKGKLSQF